MIFKKIIFNNYKTYYGIQEIDLSISKDSPEKNIILIGGLNGSGKTTFLKAILYILYGQRYTNSYLNNSQDQTKFFSNIINDNFFEEGGRECSISLIIQTNKNEEWTIIVRWYVDHTKKVSVEERELRIKKSPTSPSKNLLINKDKIETYNKIIDKQFPFFSAPFFIFDGEEIRQLIEKQDTEEMKDAIQKISGIRSNEVLLDDLNKLKQKIVSNLNKSSNYSKAIDLQNNLDSLLAQIDIAKDKYDNSRIRLLDLQNKQENIQQIKANKLISNSSSREVILKSIGNIEQNLQNKKNELQNYFKENKIYILLNDKIVKLKDRLREEKKYQDYITLKNTMLQPYEKFISELFLAKITPELSLEQKEQIKLVGQNIWLKDKRKSEQDMPYIEELHDLNNSNRNYLMNIVPKTIDPMLRIINEVDKLDNELQEIMLKLKNAPEANDVKEEEIELQNLNIQIGKEQMILNARNKKLNSLNEEKRSIESQISKLSNVKINAEELYEELKYLEKTIMAIRRYEEEYTLYKSLLIKEEFESMLNKLFRKQDEFGKIEFDINTYSIKLYNDKMREINITDRSAGEMQMISSALIWALIKASKLDVPVVIDTPLGRLDSQHRNHLVEHYYKHLSKQVIILSTDTEITSDYVELMTKSSQRQYLLDYDDSKKYSIIRDGYFNFRKGAY